MNAQLKVEKLLPLCFGKNVVPRLTSRPDKDAKQHTQFSRLITVNMNSFIISSRKSLILTRLEWEEDEEATQT